MNNLSYKAQMEENGYLILRGLLNKKIPEIFAEVNDLMDHALRLHGVKQQFDNIDQKYFYLKTHHPKIKSHFYDLCHKLVSIVQLTAGIEINQVMAQIIEGPYLIDRTQIRIDDQANDRLLPFHQETFGQISFKNLTSWIPLTNTGKQYGGIRVLPKSHKMGKLPHQFYPNMNNYHGISESLSFDYKEEILELASGDLLVFHPLLVHGSLPNPSDKIRWTVVSRFNPLESIPYLEQAEQPMYIPQEID